MSRVLAAIYTRVSTDEQAEHGISLDAQKSRLIAYCQAQGWEIYDFYIDDGYSGKDLERPQIKRIIEDAQAEKFNAIVVIKLDRLSRRQKDVLYLLEDIFEKHNVGFKSATEPFDTTTAFGKAAIGMMAVFAQLERETIVERVRMAKKEAARQGRFGGGSAPYGYTYNIATKKLEVNDMQAEVVKMIYDIYNSGKGFQLTADTLNKKGIAGPLSPTWHRDIIKKILCNPFYAGLVPRKEDVNPGKHEAIIPLSEWQTTQKRVESRITVRSETIDPENLLVGLIYCGNCGARMRFKVQRWKKPKQPGEYWVRKYYICYSVMGEPRMGRDPNCKLPMQRVADLNTAVISKIFDISVKLKADKEVLDEELGREQTNPLHSELQRLQQEIESIDKKLDKWDMVLENGDIPVEDYGRRTKVLRDQRRTVDVQIKDISEAITKEESTRLTQEELLNTLKVFPDVWEEATAEERRQLLHSVVKAIIIYPDKLYPNNVEVKLYA